MAWWDNSPGWSQGASFPTIPATPLVRTVKPPGPISRRRMRVSSISSGFPHSSWNCPAGCKTTPWSLTILRSGYAEYFASVGAFHLGSGGDAGHIHLLFVAAIRAVDITLFTRNSNPHGQVPALGWHRLGGYGWRGYRWSFRSRHGRAGLGFCKSVANRPSNFSSVAYFVNRLSIVSTCFRFYCSNLSTSVLRR